MDTANLETHAEESITTISVRTTTAKNGIVKKDTQKNAGGFKHTKGAGSVTVHTSILKRLI